MWGVKTRETSSAPPETPPTSPALPIHSLVPPGDMPAGVLGEHHHIAAHVVTHPFTKPRARSRPTIWSATSPAPPVSISACPLSSGRCILRTTRPLLAAAGDTVTSLSPPAAARSG